MKKREKDGRFALIMTLSGIIFIILVVTCSSQYHLVYLDPQPDHGRDQ
jgi:hypothetical protein